MATYFEDYHLGDKIVTAGRTVTEADISIAMGIGRYIDPFMIDEEYAKTTVFGGRIAPGRFTIFMLGGLVALSGMFDMETAIANMGFNNVRFKTPLRAGDTIKVEMEVTGKKETSKADRGLVIHTETCINQRGEVVAEMEVVHLIKRKPVD